MGSEASITIARIDAVRRVSCNYYWRKATRLTSSVMQPHDKGCSDRGVAQPIPVNIGCAQLLGMDMITLSSKTERRRREKKLFVD